MPKPQKEIIQLRPTLHPSKVEVTDFITLLDENRSLRDLIVELSLECSALRDYHSLDATYH